MKHVVTCFRVTSGLPRKRQLRQQRARIDELVSDNGLEVVKSFTDTQDDWPELGKAVAYCQEHGTSLLLANVGRLARSRHFTSRLVDTGIEFVAADDRFFNSETIHILAANAEDEAVLVSRRTKDALEEAKRQGVKLGSNRPGHWEGREHRRGFLQGSKRAAELRSKRTRDYYALITPRILEMREQGMSYYAIADELNEEGLTTQRGKPYTNVAVMRIVHRYERDTGKTVPSVSPSGRPRVRGAS